MKAIVLSEYGGVDKLELKEWAEPDPGPGQVQVRVRSASINPIDWKLRSGAAKARMPLVLPAVLGRDAAGEVTKVGAGAHDLAVGDEVMGLVMGAYAELVVAPLESWARLPPALSVMDAGALPLALLTGDQLAEATLGAPSARANETVLVTGAVGSVGRAAVWSLKSRGARVIAGVRTTQLEEAKKLGVDDVVAIDDDAQVARLPLLDGIADTVSGATIGKLLPKVKPGGRIGSVLGETPHAKELGLEVHAFMAHPDSKRLAELGRAVAKGEIAIPIARRFPLGEARLAQELAEKGGVAGKVLLMP
jgi:NADPH:quinone reductase-like Zn-dependent oxidoreductase